MKKVILTIAAIALFAVPAYSQCVVDGTPVFSLYADAEATSCRVDTQSPYQQFFVYVFLDPAITCGAFGAEFKLIIPGYAGEHFGSVAEGDDPLISVQEGSWYGGSGNSVGFTSCQYDMFWMYKLSMRCETTNPGYYEFGVHEGTPEDYLTIAFCPDPRVPLVESTAANRLGFNTDCVIGTEESSWGAIKSMMD